MTTKTTFLEPEEIRSKLAQLGGITPPERATFLCGMVVVLDENGNQHLKIAMQGEIAFNELEDCLYDIFREAMKVFLDACASADADMQ